MMALIPISGCCLFLIAADFAFASEDGAPSRKSSVSDRFRSLKRRSSLKKTKTEETASLASGTTARTTATTGTTGSTSGSSTLTRDWKYPKNFDSERERAFYLNCNRHLVAERFDPNCEHCKLCAYVYGEPKKPKDDGKKSWRQKTKGPFSDPEEFQLPAGFDFSTPIIPNLPGISDEMRASLLAHSVDFEVARLTNPRRFHGRVWSSGLGSPASPVPDYSLAPAIRTLLPIQDEEPGSAGSEAEGSLVEGPAGSVVDQAPSTPNPTRARRNSNAGSTRRKRRSSTVTSRNSVRFAASPPKKD